MEKKISVNPNDKKYYIIKVVNLDKTNDMELSSVETRLCSTKEKAEKVYKDMVFEEFEGYIARIYTAPKNYSATLSDGEKYYQNSDMENFTEKLRIDEFPNTFLCKMQDRMMNTFLDFYYEKGVCICDTGDRYRVKISIEEVGREWFK